MANGAVSLVRGVGAEPSALITQTLDTGLPASLPSSALLEVKAILLLSGDHAGESLRTPDAVILVNGFAFEPSALTNQTLSALIKVSLPSSAPGETNAILVPSGDQAAAPNTVTVVNFVIGVWPEPSALIVHTLTAEFVFKLSVPSSARRETQRILAPSGDHRGKKLPALFAVIVVSAFWAEPSGFITHMSWVAFVLGASVPSNARDD